MPTQHRAWVPVKALTPREKADIAMQCERFIAETLKPRFLPEIRPTEFNLETAVGRCEVHSVSEISRLGCIRLGRGGAGRGGGVR